MNGTQVRFGGTVPAGTPCARCSIYLDDSDVIALGLNPDAAILVGPANRYAVLQICGPAVALTTREYDPPRWLTDLIDTCSKTVITAAATWPAAIVAHRTDATAQSVSTGFACACSTGANCTWTPVPLRGGTRHGTRCAQGHDPGCRDVERDGVPAHDLYGPVRVRAVSGGVSVQ